MAKTKHNNITLTIDSRFGMRVFEAVVKVAAFVVFYLALISALPTDSALYTAVLFGLAVSVAYTVFGKKRYVRPITLIVVLVYTILCVAAGFDEFIAGAASYANGVVAKANEYMHYGFASVDISSNFGCDLLFASVCSAWLALGVSVLVDKAPGIYIFCMSLTALTGLCFGLYPSIFVLFGTILVSLALLISKRGFSLKTAGYYVASAAVFLAILSSCFLYTGSIGMKNFKKNISSGIDDMIYGSDALPEGRLENAGDLHASDKERLSVTLGSELHTLYLKGFVGATLDGGEWQTTDKNAYVQNGYRGIVEYLHASGYPFAQYSRYSELDGTSNRYGVYVNNTAASRKYMYLPYTLSTTDIGEKYFDQTVRGGASVYSYGFNVFGNDGSSERITQSQWLVESENRTSAMDDYIARESEYRAFVYDVYTAMDDETRAAATKAVNGVETSSVNTATQVIRAYFSDAFVYSDSPDKINAQFLAEFFGGNIKKANAPYFASAATYIFRSYGFAARYVEGYLVSSDNDDIGGEKYTVGVTDADAHAWTEVYFDGIGWLPIEVTPGYYSDEFDNATVDPEDPDNNVSAEIPSAPEKPVDKPDDNTNTTPPTTEPITSDGDKTDEGLMTALRVLVPIVSVLSAIVLALLVIVVRRELILKCRRNKLALHGEAFGRAISAIATENCKRFGGFGVETLEKYGIMPVATERFIQIVEHCVYGDYDPDANEKEYVLNYIVNLAAVLTNRDGKLRALVRKYILCLGI